jgi:hypothetical protein
VSVFVCALVPRERGASWAPGLNSYTLPEESQTMFTVRVASASAARISCALWSAMLIFSCGGGPNSPGITPPSPTLRQAASARGLGVSTAVATPYLAESDYSNALGSEYGGLTAEWEMKFTATHPRPNTDPFSLRFLCWRPTGRVCSGACHASSRTYPGLARR